MAFAWWKGQKKCSHMHWNGKLQWKNQKEQTNTPIEEISAHKRNKNQTIAAILILLMPKKSVWTIMHDHIKALQTVSKVYIFAFVMNFAIWMRCLLMSSFNMNTNVVVIVDRINSKPIMHLIIIITSKCTE